jgi:hypothetical protein
VNTPQRIRQLPWEAIIWAVGLMALALYNPATDNHITLCPFSNLGFDFCPGCGLGRSILLLYKGEVTQSFQRHPLGIFAVIILVYRILSLTLTHIKRYGQNP